MNYNIFLLLFLLLVSCQNKEFDSKLWKEWRENEVDWNLRWDMTDDLINNYRLKGKTLQQIEELLGGEHKECASGSYSIYYNLGPCRSGISYGTLQIDFKDNKVFSFEKRCG